jgi:hypothetical protein
VLAYQPLHLAEAKVPLAEARYRPGVLPVRLSRTRQ